MPSMMTFVVDIDRVIFSAVHGALDEFEQPAAPVEQGVDDLRTCCFTAQCSWSAVRNPIRTITLPCRVVSSIWRGEGILLG